MNVLLLSCRDLLGRATGRKQVLWTTLESLHDLGHTLSIAHFGSLADLDLSRLRRLTVASVHCLKRPSAPQMLANCTAGMIAQGWSFNEALFFSKSNLRKLIGVVKSQRIDFAVCDMIRMAPYASKLGVPWHLDMDDQLSQRYWHLSKSSHANDQLLGYYGQMLPGWLRSLTTFAAKKLLPVEAKLMHKREAYWCGKASSVSLVSQREADSLASRTRREVACLPMRATFPGPEYSTESRTADSIVFLGGLDYQPNLDALRYYRDQIAPCLAARGLGHITCEVIGNVPDRARKELTTDSLILQGYVRDLSEHLSRHSVFVAPITHGTGIKTKVLDAMGHRLAVVATPQAVEGLAVADGEHCLIRDTPEGFAEGIESLLGDPARAAAIGNNAYNYVQDAFSLPIIAERWQRVLGAAFPQSPGRPRQTQLADQAAS
jgi:hypothetical protein